MMIIKQYDKAQLKTGEIAWIVEIFDNGKAFHADIDREDGTETDHIFRDDIAKVFK